LAKSSGSTRAAGPGSRPDRKEARHLHCSGSSESERATRADGARETERVRAREPVKSFPEIGESLAKQLLLPLQPLFATLCAKQAGQPPASKSEADSTDTATAISTHLVGAPFQLANLIQQLKMAAAAASAVNAVNDCFSIGSTVVCTTCFNEEVEGEVLAFDHNTKMLILSILLQRKHTHLTAR